MRIAVFGVGLIGGSIGLAARKQVEGAEVVGFGRRPERLEQAQQLGAIDRVGDSLEDALVDAQACFVCGPVGALRQQVGQALGAAGRDCVVTDVGSTKRHVVESTSEKFLPTALESAGVQWRGR